MTNSDARHTPQASIAVAEVSSLFIYPVKSCRRVEVDQVTVGADRLVGDRQWQVAAGKLEPPAAGK